MKENSSDSNKIGMVYPAIGILILFASLLFLPYFLRETNNEIGYFIWLIVIDISATYFLAYLPGKINYEKGKIAGIDGHVKSQGSPAMFLIILGTGIAYNYWHSTHPQKFGLTAYIRSVNEQTILRSGKIQLLLGNSRPIEDIDGSGSVFFRDIPSAFKNKSARIELLQVPEFQFINGKMVDTIELSDQPVILNIEPTDKLCFLKGEVISQKGERIPNVKVWAENFPHVKTDSIGRFTIIIPKKHCIEEAFNVYAQKGHLKGYLRMSYVQESVIEIR